MRDRCASSIVALVGVLVFSSGALAQAPAYEPHDIQGLWTRTSRVLTMSDEVPPMTAWAEAKFDAARPGYGPRAVPPGLGNDPMGTCDPLGLPRLLFLEVSIYPMEILQTPERVLQFFEWGHVWREIWTDGRELPTDPEPRWLGYSVGRWEGDTFVVDSVGFEERTWLDHFGNPVSDDMRLEERYHRLDRETLELTMTINAPKAYAAPWVSETKILKLAPEEREIEELFCVPTEEQAFNRLVRNPAAGVTVP